MARVESVPNRLRTAVFTFTIVGAPDYEFSVGGNTYVIGSIPPGAIVTDQIVDVTTPLAQEGGGLAPQVTLSYSSGQTILSQRTFTAAPYDASGPVQVAITPFKTASSVDITWNVNANVLGAGTVTVFVQYLIGP